MKAWIQLVSLFCVELNLHISLFSNSENVSRVVYKDVLVVSNNTNNDYRNEIEALKVKKEFTYTSYLYNYIWYGEFDVNDEQFDKAKRAFVSFIKSIKAWTKP